MMKIDDDAESSLYYLVPFRKKKYYVYNLILILLLCCLSALPFIKTDISVNARGIVRPSKERTEVKNIIDGIIDRVCYKEGDTVLKGAVLLQIRNNISHSKKRMNSYEIKQRQTFVVDLETLINNKLADSLLYRLKSPLYKRQMSQYLSAYQERTADLRKATNELKINQVLVDQKVISPKEFFDTQVAYDKATAFANSLEREQRASWQQDLVKYSLEISEYENELNLVRSEESFYEIKAPITGTIQNINTIYAGGSLATGEVICQISPDDSLQAECYVLSKDIGLIRRNQMAIFQIDAFNYNYFGTIQGRVKSISNDYILQDQNQTPVFIVRCLFNTTHFKLKNGYQNDVKRGLTFQARFIIGHRTLWQLLWDKLDDWINPNSSDFSNI